MLDSYQDSDAVSAYYAEDAAADETTRIDGVRLDARLGLAVEAMPDGLTTLQLWTVI